VQLAVWDNPAASFLVSGLESSPVRSAIDVITVAQTDALRRCSPAASTWRWFLRLTHLLEHEAVDVLPAVALSSWDYPLARIRLPSGLENKPRRLIADARYQQEAFVAGLVLKEHYRMMPEITWPEGDRRLTPEWRLDRSLTKEPRVPISCSIWGRSGMSWQDIRCSGASSQRARARHRRK
jgi:chorismate dehydratase